MVAELAKSFGDFCEDPKVLATSATKTCGQGIDRLKSQSNQLMKKLLNDPGMVAVLRIIGTVEEMA